MTYIITYKDNYKDGFIRWLIDQVAVSILSHVNSPRINQLNKFVSDSNLFKQDNSVDIRKAVIYAVRNFKVRKIKTGWEVFIDPNILYPNTSIKVVTLCKLVDAGVIGIRGTNLFTNEFNFVTTNLKRYYEMYMSEV